MKVAQPIETMDFEKFRLRTLANRLLEIGEAEIYNAPISLADLSRTIENSKKSLIFKNVGPQKYEMISAVSGSRARIAAAFGVAPKDVAHEYMRRLRAPQPIVEVPREVAPVRQVVKLGDDIDLTQLPFHVQHEYDGGTYISSGIDYSVDPVTKRTNVGCRRLMLRGRREMRANLTDASDLKRCYIECLKRGERLPVSYVIGSGPLDFMVASGKQPFDEFGLIATLRGEPVPMVRGITNDILVPADAEMVIEGYFDELGYRELEGPYGEFYGFYGPVHIDPVFHATAISMRHDVLHQTILHSGAYLSRTDSANLASINTEVAVWNALRGVRIEPTAVNCVPASNGRQHVRVAINQTAVGQARAVISTLFALAPAKQIFVVDSDIDVFDDEQVEWAMSTRFKPEHDVILSSGLPAFYADPNADENLTVSKVGFDLTKSRDFKSTIDNERAFAKTFDFKAGARFSSPRQALENGPLFFADLMEAVGSEDGREVALALDELREAGVLIRSADGRWAIKGHYGEGFEELRPDSFPELF
jgi:UbiD family decarboxylase